MRLLLLMLAVAVPPLVGLGLVMMNVNADALRLAARELHLAIAGDVRRTLRGELERAQQELDGVGYLLLAPGLGSGEERDALVASKLTASAAIDFVTLYSPQGERLGTLKEKELPLPAVPEMLPTSVLQAHPESQQGLQVLDVVMKNGVPSLRVVQRARKDGATQALLLTHLRLEPLLEQLRTLGEDRLGSRNAISVVNDARQVVLHADPARIGTSRKEHGIFMAVAGDASFRSPFGVSPEFNDDGEPMVGALETLPELGWAVVVQRPRALAYASLGWMRTGVGVALAICAVVALAGALLGARQLARPIEALVRATRDIAGRRFTRVEGGVEERQDELGHLGRSLGEMARSLESSEKELVEQTRVRTALSRYLSSDVVELIAREPERLRLGGERREVTVLFSDVCGFTRLSESLPPETVVALLNELFTFATEIIHRRGGIIDKFIGDSVMAVWGTPESKPDDARQAVEAAMELRRWVETGNRRWRQKWGVEVQLAMGLHTGTVVAGNLGSEKRMEYTVIGDTVNVAARLESMAQPGQILVSAATREKLGPDAEVLRHLGERALHGRNATTSVFEVAA
ncbi:adenylate/guanylate cyclase domain-containing protein [Hyalangium minutum]|uniref:Adenylate cyclase n=1 Tax=Hyalangium minutum TaxID=394096 RepID=A0A085W3N0_9BACT|nr:adenylate/guanylate cyclase domain-containing protein [Hyalangium minutum]KFE62293.1 Adenylate cyclase [Hyalangium minutum]